MVIVDAKVDFTKDEPKKGQVQINFRAIMKDKHLIDHAAVAMNMRQADFCRIVMVRAAEDVLRQQKILQSGQDLPKPAEEAAIVTTDTVVPQTEEGKPDAGNQ